MLSTLYRNIDLKNAGLTVHLMERLSSADVLALQALCEKCKDFMQLTWKRDVLVDEAERLFDELPSGKTTADKVMLGISSVNSQLVGMCELIRDYKVTGEWCLATLLLHPDLRGKGAGSTFVEALLDAIGNENGFLLTLIVQEQNHGALRFWGKCGCELYDSRDGDHGREFLMKYEIIKP